MPLDVYICIAFFAGAFIGGIVGFAFGESLGRSDTERRWSEAVARKHDSEAR